VNWQDELEIRRLVEAYGVAVDDLDPDAIAELFVSGGRLLVYEAGSDELKYSYSSTTFAELTDALRTAYKQTFHLVGNVVVQVDGDQAAGTVYCLAGHWRDSRRGPEVSWYPVRYADRFRRTDAGWRFAERRSTLLWHERRPMDGRLPSVSSQ
jgi:hypothetical protein